MYKHLVKDGQHAAPAPAKPAAVQRQATAAGSRSPLFAAGPAITLRPAVQAKVAVGPANDAYEREADAVAQRVVSGQPVPALSTIPAGGLAETAQRQPAEAEETEGEEVAPLQRKAAAQPVLSGRDVVAAMPAGAVRAEIAAQAVTSPGPGHSLAGETAGVLQRAFNADLGQVRVHSDSESQETAAALGARAFTHGRDIWLGPGESEHNLSLMAHEVTHTFQQGASVRRLQDAGANVDDADATIGETPKRDKMISYVESKLRAIGGRHFAAVEGKEGKTYWEIQETEGKRGKKTWTKVGSPITNVTKHADVTKSTRNSIVQQKEHK